jgi:hypothetical protein
VHLFIAANGNMPWQPVESREQACFAEYNAVLLEHLLVNCFNAAVLESMAPEQIVPEARKFLKWFVSEHYAPFPVSEKRLFATLLRLWILIASCGYFPTSTVCGLGNASAPPTAARFTIWSLLPKMTRSGKRQNGQQIPIFCKPKSW